MGQAVIREVSTIPRFVHDVDLVIDLVDLVIDLLTSLRDGGVGEGANTY